MGVNRVSYLTHYDSLLQNAIKIITKCDSCHCVNSVQIRSFFWSVFSYTGTEYRKIRTRKNYVFGNFSRGVFCYKMRQKFITKCGRCFITKFDSFITNCHIYYNLQRFYQKRDSYYKTQCFLQIATVG